MRKFSIFILLALMHVNSWGQKNAEQALQIIHDKYLQEKIHLFFNKETYVAGETMWFQATVFSGYVLSYISTNLYIEIYNQKKQLLDSAIIPLIEASGNGSFKINKQWPEGIYYVRAYTKWMMNFNESFQYVYGFPVYNPESESMLAPGNVKWSPEIYPESGNFVANIENKVAVRLRPDGGPLPDKWYGYITDGDDTTKKLASFHSFNPEVSSFTFKPSAEKKYLVFIFDNLGNQSVRILNPASNGLILKAAQIGDSLLVNIISSVNQKKHYKLLGQMQDEIVFRAELNHTDGSIRLAVPVSKWLNGVLQLTLFDEEEKPLCERLLYIEVDSVHAPELNTRKLSLEKRGENSWQIFSDSTTFVYAVSVEDSAFSAPRNRNILSDLWLGDFPDNIFEPAWYFTSSDANRLKALDALLMSEKWTRFNWDEILAGHFPSISYQPDNYLSYVGTATRKGKILNEESLSTLFKFKDSSIRMAQVKTDKLGKFSLNHVAFYDSAKLYCLTKNAANIQIEMETQNHFIVFKGAFPYNSFSVRKRKENDLTPSVKNILNSIQNQVLLEKKYNEMEEVKVQTRAKTAKQKLNEKLSSPLFQTETEAVFDFIHQDQAVQSYPNIFDWLQGRVAGLDFVIENENYKKPAAATSMVPAEQSLSRQGQRIPIMRSGEVAVYIDEMPTDYEAIYSLPVSEIAMVKVIKGYFPGGVGGGGGSGAIAIYTKNAGVLRNAPATSLPMAIIAGYRAVPPFDTPDYSDEFIRTIKNDTRDQLFWSSNLGADSNGNLFFHFYNNDITTKYRVVITGFTKNAKPVYLEKIVSIK